MALTITVTNAGRAALVNAANTGTAAVTIAQVGVSGVAVAPSPAATNLTGETKRIATLSGDVVADDTIHLIVRDESTSVYTVRSFALYLADGTLFAIYGQADPILEKSSQAIMLLAIDVQFADIAAAQLTFGNTNFLNPPATTEIKGVVELATSTETNTGTDTERAVTPRAFADALSTRLDARFGPGNSAIWHPGNDGAGSGLDADLLDGQEGSYYTNIPARLGYTPINRAGDTVTATISFRTNDSASIATRPNSLAALHAIGNGTGPAIMSFERPNAFAAYLGVDTDNRWKVGGWSMGAVAYDLWHSGNDGSGSGLDADLLDGQDSSYFVNIPARLGYTPANRAGDTFTGPVTVPSFTNTNGRSYLGADANGNHWLGAVGIASEPGRLGYGFRTSNGAIVSHTFMVGGAARLVISDTSMLFNSSLVWNAGNDGAGSGMDADLLDGQEGAYYANIPARLGFTPANRAGDTFTGSIRRDDNLYIDLLNGNPIINFDGYDYFQFGRTTNTLSLYIGGAVQAYCGPDGYLWARAGITVNGQIVWHGGNDGSGSGLDADLLDGQQGSYYTDIPSRLGYSPINRAGDTLTATIRYRNTDTSPLASRPSTTTALHVTTVEGGPALMSFERPNAFAGFLGIDTDNRWKVGGWSMGTVAYELWHSGNDGSGSGLDADLLDGQDGSYYANIPARLGYTPFSSAGGGISGPVTINYSGNASVTLNSTGAVIARFSAQTDGNIVFYRNAGSGDAVVWSVGSQTGPFNVAMPLTRQGNVVWDAANDGSGSGLDADTLDGLQGSDYLRIIAESKSASGYMRLSNGLVLQWGRWTSPATAGQAITVTFPIAFSEEPYTLVTMAVVTTASDVSTWSSNGITGSSFPARCSIASVGCRYFAVGPV